jgi:GTP cyclohydrolase IV
VPLGMTLLIPELSVSPAMVLLFSALARSVPDAVNGALRRAVGARSRAHAGATENRPPDAGSVRWTRMTRAAPVERRLRRAAPNQPRYAPGSMEPTPLRPLPDVQASAPAIRVSLSRVGVTNVEKVIRIDSGDAERLYYAKLDCFVDLGPRHKGTHMSRFEEVVNDAIGEVILGESAFRAETLAQHVAEKVRDRQGARRAEVRIDARYPEYKPAPVSGIATQEIYTLHGIAVAGVTGTKRLVGVTAQGMTACPCAQALVQSSARERLLGDGFGDEQIERIFDAVPVATHNQRGLGTLHLGLPEESDTDVDAAELLAIVEDSMSSEIYELMKRSDEGAVVEKAARRPRFVEDCVREAIRGAIERFGDLNDDAFVSARQENLETVHQHNVVAERFGQLGELRRELDAGQRVAHHTTMREWLDAAG